RYHRRKDGSVFPVTVTVSPFVLNEHDMLMVVVKDNSERQALETALWESQSKYRQLFEAASNPIVIFDTNTQHVFDVNGAAIELYGYTKEEWNDLTTAKLSDEREQSRTALTSGNKRAHLIPLRWHKKKDGTRFPVEISVGNSYLFQGRSLACATLRDMTERKASEEALRAERDFNQTLVQTSPAFFFAINEDGRIRMMNNAMLEALHYKAEEVIGQDFLTRFVPMDERRAVTEEFESLLQSMRPSIREWQVADKHHQPCLVEWHSRAVLKADGSTDFLFGVGIDLTERRQAQSDRSLFKTIIDISEEAIAIRDAEGLIIYENPAHERLFGRALRETGLYKEDLYPPESLEIIKRDIRPNLDKGESWSGEMSILDADGQVLPVWQRAEAVRDEETGEILYEFELMHDISERQRMWETLRNQWEEYQLIFNNVPVMIWHRDKDNKLLRANKLATETFLPEDTEQAFYIDNLTVLQSGETRLSTVELHSSILKDNCWLQVGKAPYRNSANELMGVIIFAVDITAYKKGQPDTEYVKLLLEQLPVVLNAFDRSGRLVAWNKMAELVSGYRTSEVLNDSGALEMLYPDESSRRLLMDHLLEQVAIFHRHKQVHAGLRDDSFIQTNGRESLGQSMMLIDGGLGKRVMIGVRRNQELEI
ncbi:MAG: PAS domain-containing protein, partial [Pseudomonadota bacterium]